MVLQTIGDRLGPIFSNEMIYNMSGWQLRVYKLINLDSDIKIMGLLGAVMVPAWSADVRQGDRWKVCKNNQQQAKQVNRQNK